MILNLAGGGKKRKEWKKKVQLGMILKDPNFPR